MSIYMKLNEAQDFFTESIASKAAIKFTKQSEPLLGLKGLTMADGLNKDVRKSKRWLNIRSDETQKCKLAISVTYSNGRYYVFIVPRIQRIHQVLCQWKMQTQCILKFCHYLSKQVKTFIIHLLLNCKKG